MIEGTSPEEIIIYAIQTGRIEVAVHVDLKDGNMMQIMALVDTGSSISFMNQTVLEEVGSRLLQDTVPFAKRVVGISGEVVPVKGSLSLTCSIAGRTIVHEFIIAEIAETALLGMDFLQRHRAAWDWNIGEMVFQDEGEDQEGRSEQVCCLQVTQEVLPGTVQCLRVALDPSPNPGDLVHLQTAAWKNLPTGVKACDVTGVAGERETLIMIENRGGQVQVLSAGTVVADWELVSPRTLYQPVSRTFPEVRV